MVFITELGNTFSIHCRIPQSKEKERESMVPSLSSLVLGGGGGGGGSDFKQPEQQNNGWVFFQIAKTPPKFPGMGPLPINVVLVI